MSYGIYDCDIRNGAPMLNLELMKLSSYYKGKGEIVAYSSRFSPERFNHFIIGKDRIDEYFNYPIYQYNNIETIGRFFSPKKYYPMDLAIEKQIPDTYLYNKLPNRYGLGYFDGLLYKSQLEAEHLRLSLDGKTVWTDFDKQLNGYGVDHTISIYDYNINAVEGVTDVLQDLVVKPFRKQHHRLLFKFPIRVDHAVDLAPWLNFTYYQHRTKFVIENPLNKEDINFLYQNKEQLRMEPILYDISKNNTYENFLANIILTYKQIYFLRSILTNFSLIYDEDFFPDIEWKNFINLLNGFSLSRGRKFKGQVRLFELFSEYIKYFYYKQKTLNGVTVEEARDCFRFIANENRELFKMFYEYKGE